MNARKQFSMIGWALCAFYLVSTAGQLLLGITMQQFGRWLPDGMWSEDFLMISSLVIMYGIGFPVFLLIVKRLPSWYKEERKSISPGILLTVFVVCLGAAYIGNMIGTAMMMFGNLFFGIQSLNPVTDTFLNMTPEVMLWTTVIAAPIMEELMFRKILIDRLIPMGQKQAVLFSGLVFALFHGNFYQFFYAWGLGMIFAYLYSYTGKLRYSVLMHMGINFVGGMLPFLLERWAGTHFLGAWLLSLLLGGLSLTAMIASIALTVIFFGRVTWYPAWKKPERGVCYAVFTASGVWAFLLICAVEFMQMF